MHQKLEEIKSHFLSLAGRSTQEFGLGRILGQVYFLLLFCAHPLCLDDIAKRLGISKASASNAVRELEKWRALRRSWLKGDRKDYFIAETDFGKILNNGFFAQLVRKVDSANIEIKETQQTLEDLKSKDVVKKEDLDTFKLYKQRLSELRKTLEAIKFLLDNINF